jgi:hypothetical protein
MFSIKKMKSTVSISYLNLGLMILLLGLLATLPACDAVPGLSATQVPTEASPTPVGENTPPEIVQSGTVRQWAIAAEASSNYDNPEWAAIQATGAPDTARCGDIQTAWASASSDDVDWLELEYAEPVYASAVNIYQTFNPNQVVKVELVSTLGRALTIYQSDPVQVDQPCPFILSIVVEKTNTRYNRVRLTVDQSTTGLGWNEIDAVELVGDAERTE